MHCKLKYRRGISGSPPILCCSPVSPPIFVSGQVVNCNLNVCLVGGRRGKNTPFIPETDMLNTKWLQQH